MAPDPIYLYTSPILCSTFKRQYSSAAHRHPPSSNFTIDLPLLSITSFAQRASSSAVLRFKQRLRRIYRTFSSSTKLSATVADMRSIGGKAPRRQLKLARKPAVRSRNAAAQSRYTLRSTTQRSNATTATSDTASSSIKSAPSTASAGDDKECETEQWPFRFLDLPPELRNHVYSFVFKASPASTSSELGVIRVIDPAPLSVTHNNTQWRPGNRNISMLSILQVCRQIYEEARDIPFMTNLVHFQ